MLETNQSYCRTDDKKYSFLILVEKCNYFIVIDSSLVTNSIDVIDSDQKDYFHEK